MILSVYEPSDRGALPRLWTHPAASTSRLSTITRCVTVDVPITAGVTDGVPKFAPTAVAIRRTIPAKPNAKHLASAAYTYVKKRSTTESSIRQ
jgi:hypothetical protein